MQVLHFNEFSQDQSENPDPCLKYKQQKVLADSSIKGQKETMERLSPQVRHRELLPLFFTDCVLLLAVLYLVMVVYPQTLGPGCH